MSECQFYAGNLHAKLDRIIALLEKLTAAQTVQVVNLPVLDADARYALEEAARAAVRASARNREMR